MPKGGGGTAKTDFSIQIIPRAWEKTRATCASHTARVVGTPFHKSMCIRLDVRQNGFTVAVSTYVKTDSRWPF